MEYSYLNKYRDFNKVLRVIDSCRTEEQFNSAENMIVLLINKYKDAYVKLSYHQLHEHLIETKNLRAIINNMEKRMYFFVPYQLTGIQQGIQCGHVALEYAKIYSNDVDFIDFRDNWKTWVILNGGTTNKDPEKLGSLNIIFKDLIDNQINCEAFYEPDLGDQMTAICFICDERVFNKEDYPDYEDLYIDSSYDEWYVMIGGFKNFFLRELLSGKKTA